MPGDKSITSRYTYPCMNCDKRSAECHSTCAAYLAVVQKKEQYQIKKLETIQLENDMFGLFIKRVKRGQDKMRMR